MARRVVWSLLARENKKAIFQYWNDHNKSKSYSHKLNRLFNDTADLLQNYPYLGRKTTVINVYVMVINNFLMIYEVLDSSDILILTIRDGRSKPLV